MNETLYIITQERQRKKSALRSLIFYWHLLRERSNVLQIYSLAATLTSTINNCKNTIIMNARKILKKKFAY